MNPPRRLARRVLHWPVESQQRSRRNARVAATALARLRAEREEVEEFLARDARRHARPVASPAATRDVI